MIKKIGFITPLTCLWTSLANYSAQERTSEVGLLPLKRSWWAGSESIIKKNCFNEVFLTVWLVHRKIWYMHTFFVGLQLGLETCQKDELCMVGKVLASRFRKCGPHGGACFPQYMVKLEGSFITFKNRKIALKWISHTFSGSPQRDISIDVLGIPIAPKIPELRPHEGAGTPW